MTTLVFIAIVLPIICVVAMVIMVWRLLRVPTSRKRSDAAILAAARSVRKRDWG